MAVMYTLTPYTTYEICFERLNGTRDKDYFHAKNEFMAISMFKTCYRNSVYKVISIKSTNL